MRLIVALLSFAGLIGLFLAIFLIPARYKGDREMINRAFNHALAVLVPVIVLDVALFFLA
jgi:hypothetical protein